jgi:hypothetical protein
MQIYYPSHEGARMCCASNRSKSAVKSIKKEMLNLQAGAATSYSTPK